MVDVEASFHTARPYTHRTDSQLRIQIRLVLGTHLGPNNPTMAQAWVFEACQDLIRVFSRPLNLPHAYCLCACRAASLFSVMFMSVRCTSSSCSSLNHLLHYSQLEQPL